MQLEMIETGRNYLQFERIERSRFRMMYFIQLFSYSLSFCVVLDQRRGPCWMTVRNGRCEEEIRMNTSKMECCASVGAAWGSPCESCPKIPNGECEPNTSCKPIVPGKFPINY